MNSSQLVSYDIFKSFILGNVGIQDGLPVHILSSALAGTVATTISAPADVVRSRVMNMGPNNQQGIVGMITDSLKKEGPRFLFRGWLPAWSESGVQNMNYCANVSPFDTKHHLHVRLPGTIAERCGYRPNKIRRPSSSRSTCLRTS